MTAQTYLTTTRAALEAVRKARVEALSLLPPAVLQQYWVVRRHDTSPWPRLVFWYQTQPEVDPEIAHILSDLDALSQAREHLYGVIAHAASVAREPDLSLPKVRPFAGGMQHEE